ncbi:hypothetical protein HCN51_46580 [Nonomuraea sp. FMUSA5-5]|uniref:Uncharacterized protein n=1 Tax=Nonomuraea composti TaxID=2720023 RepID=A0ABX1BNT0_9ACTN|nr:hypothetical protein [Nonomuraea sp. FMUSA5-5]
MSQYYQVGEHVLWNPSNGVSALFLRTAQALAPETGLPTGLGPMESDECQIDLPAFTAFVGALVDRYERANHPILHALMEGFIATALVLVQRGEEVRDVQTPKDGRWGGAHGAARPGDAPVNAGRAHSVTSSRRPSRPS